MTSGQQRVVVLGGGAAGMMAAYTLARAGAAVTVLERETRVGGLCGTHEKDGFRFDLGGHRFISRNRELHAIIQELLGDDLLLRTRSSVVLHGGRQYQYPLDLQDVLEKVSPAHGARILASYAKERVGRRLRDDDATFEQWVTHRFGRALYDDFFGPYTEKLWGLPPSQISADWASQRISLLSLSDVMLRLAGLRRGNARTYARRYHYPKLGIGQIFERMAEKTAAAGGKLLGGARVTGLDTFGNRVTAVRYVRDGAEREVACDAVISTIALPLAARMLGRSSTLASMPVNVLESADRLRFRAIRLCNVLLDLPEVSPHTWMYVSEPTYLMTRIQEPRRRSPFAAPEGKTSLMLEIPCDVGDDVWNAADGDIYDRCMHDLEKLGFRGLPRATLGHFSTFVPEGYPIYHLEYQRDRAALLGFVGERAANLVTCGRQGAFRYIFMDTAMEMGVAAAAAVLERGGARLISGVGRQIADLRAEQGLVETQALTA
jgi:protoporphyrinogen oxidase